MLLFLVIITKMKHKSITIRMKLHTLWRLKRAFPAYRDESAAHYFERVAEFLENRII